MRVGDLIRYGLPCDLVRQWEQDMGPYLLPLQEQAVKHYDLFGGDNLLIQAPTSSGKTFIGEMAALYVALQRRKAVYLVPLKALAVEKHREFTRKYGTYGVDVLISTRDHREWDARFEAGDFSIAVAVYEKFAQLLVRRPERLQEIGVVIADEFELLADPERGASVELLLTHLLRSQRRLLGLSAVLGEAERLAAWFNARLLVSHERPVALRQGILREGVYHYRTLHGCGEGTEELAPNGSFEPGEMLLDALAALVERGETCLVFVKTKHESRRGAQLAASRIDAPAADRTLARLRELEPTRSRTLLLETLAAGAAFHNADLTPAEREAIEEGCRRGEIKALVSTATLAQGMNLPARNVFLAPDKWRYDARLGLPWKAPILHSEFQNMSGRAARYGAVTDFGRAILLASTPFEHETLWQRYIEGERERIEPRLHTEPLDNAVLRLVAARMCTTRQDVSEFLQGTLSGQWFWEVYEPPETLERAIDTALDRDIEAGLLAALPDGQLMATSAGHAAAAKGLRVGTVQRLKAWLRYAEARRWTIGGLVWAVANTEDGRLSHVALTMREYEGAGYASMLEEAIGEEFHWPLDAETESRQMPRFEAVRAMKAALILLDWIGQTPVCEIEELRNTMAGQIMAAAEQAGWLAEGAAALAKAHGMAASFVEELGMAAERIRYGLREEAMPLARLHLPGLTRTAITALVAQGLCTPEALAEASDDTLSLYLNPQTLREVRDWAQEALGARHSAQAKPDEPVLVLDARNPRALRVYGKRVQLQDKQFRLLCALAAAPGECVPYDTIYEAVWGDAVVEQNQLHFQKSGLLGRIRLACPDGPNLIETVPKRGFVLKLTASEIQFHPLRSPSPA